MRRRLGLVLLLAAMAQARPSRLLDANDALTQFFSGQMSVNQAANRLSFLGEERYASEEVLAALKRRNSPQQRNRLYELLLALGERGPDLERLFIGALGSSDNAEVVLAARALGQLTSVDAVKPLLARLGDPNPGIRREVARALGAIGVQRAAGPLMKAASTEQELELKVVMLSAVGRCADRAQAPALERQLTDSSETTRLAATQALCSLGSPVCAAQANRRLASADASERLQAVMLLEFAPLPTARAVLKPVLVSTDDRQRARAARVLVQRGDRTLVEWLVRASATAPVESKLVYEAELETLRVSDDERQKILTRPSASPVGKR